MRYSPAKNGARAKKDSFHQNWLDTGKERLQDNRSPLKSIPPNNPTNPRPTVLARALERPDPPVAQEQPFRVRALDG